MGEIKFWIREVLRNIIMRFFSIFYKSEKNNVLFSSFGGRQYSDNPRAISEKLHEINGNIKIVWVLKSKEHCNLPSYVKIINNDFFSLMKAMLKAKVWVFNNDVKYGTYKKKNQYYIQTWHGDRVPKKVKYDALESMGKDKYKSVHIIENKICDLCVAGSDLGEQVYKSAFRYEGEILKMGMPRNDCLIVLSQSRIASIKEMLGVEKNKILLYAPTFRDNNVGETTLPFDPVRLINILENKTRNKWIILIRAHALSKFKKVHQSCIIDVSAYDDMADLLLISDILVSDYSSSIGDYILLERPIILFQYDYEKYIRTCRDFNFDFGDKGFIVAKTKEEFYEKLDNLEIYDFNKISSKIIDSFNITESGYSSKVIAHRIEDIISEAS